MEYIVRLESVKLENFKNVENGVISLIKPTNAMNTLKKLSEDNLVSDVIGIYGQNGSGKSAIVDSLYFLKKLLKGESLEDEAIHYIKKGCEYLCCSYEFFLIPKKEKLPKIMLTYSFTLSLVDSEKFGITREELRYKSFSEEGESSSGKIIEYDKTKQGNELNFMTQENIRKLRAYSKVSYKTLEAFFLINKEQHGSFIFYNDNLHIFVKAFEKIPEISESLFSLHNYGVGYLFVFRNDFSGMIMENKVFPLSYSKEEKERRLLAEFIYRYKTSPIEIYDEQIDTLQNIISNLNIVLSAIIPEMKLELGESEMDIDIKGKKTRTIFLFSNRNGNKIPFKYESDGIKKIVSILGLIIDMYNNPSVTIVVDELDSGIFEYLLGELLKILEDNACGQLFFTSHNLRPLELLNHKSLFFTTVNAKKRYTKLADVNSNNNVRDVYYTNIQLGNKNDDLYEMVNSYTIKNALYESGLKVGE